MVVPRLTRSESRQDKLLRQHQERRQRFMRNLLMAILAMVSGIYFLGRVQANQEARAETPSPAIAAASAAQDAEPNNQTEPGAAGEPAESSEAVAQALPEPAQKPEALDGPVLDARAVLGMQGQEPSPAAEHAPAAGEADALPNTAELPLEARPIAYVVDAPISYYAQSGDSLGVLAVRYGVDASEIRSTGEIPAKGFIPAGQLLLIPNKLGETSPGTKIFPDSEVANSPSAVGFDLEAYVASAGGYLASYQEPLYANGMKTGAEIVAIVAKEFAIHPRLLLALLEYESNWVFGQPASEEARSYPLGFIQEGKVGLYKQLVMAAGVIESGYYGWREGTVVALTFPDGRSLRLAAELNCGSVGMMYYFAQKFNFDDWYLRLYGEHAFVETYNAMFGNAWLIAQEFEPLFTPAVLQPELILPFEPGVTWSYTGGPHAAWGAAQVLAAIDFAPPSAATGCLANNAWVVASAAGLVVRSENGAVVVDLDGDGLEETGWNLIYLHIATTDRVPVGTWLEQGQRIGHPSCEGGSSTGTHLHMARKYNGEWVPAEGPLAFDLQGWEARAGRFDYKGWLVRGDQVITANLFGAQEAHISREK